MIKSIMISIVIQAGGQSSRMGQDKGLGPLNSVPLNVLSQTQARQMPLSRNLKIDSSHFTLSTIEKTACQQYNKSSQNTKNV